MSGTKTPKRGSVDYDDPAILEEILVRQRRDMWTPEQIDSLSKHFRLEPGMTLLDAGCGFGYSLRTFGPRCLPGGALVGLDQEQHLIDTAAKLAGAKGLGDAATFRLGDIHEMPFDDDTFDVVMCQVVMCHLPDPEPALDELIRVTRRGGCIAVFDNAATGCGGYWSSTDRPTIAQRLRRCEHRLLNDSGRKKLGRGEWSVGLKMPAWMEARGLENVDARVNERVGWIAPPYRSPAQQGALRHAREQMEDPALHEMDLRNMAESMRTVGVDEKIICSAVRSARRRESRFHDALRAGHAAYAYGGTFWCIWGFKA